MNIKSIVFSIACICSLLPIAGAAYEQSTYADAVSAKQIQELLQSLFDDNAYDALKEQVKTLTGDDAHHMDELLQESKAMMLKAQNSPLPQLLFYASGAVINGSCALLMKIFGIWIEKKHGIRKNHIIQNNVSTSSQKMNRNQRMQDLKIMKQNTEKTNAECEENTKHNIELLSKIQPIKNRVNLLLWLGGVMFWIWYGGSHLYAYYETIRTELIRIEELETILQAGTKA